MATAHATAVDESMGQRFVFEQTLELAHDGVVAPLSFKVGSMIAAGNWLHWIVRIVPGLAELNCTVNVSPLSSVMLDP